MEKQEKKQEVSRPVVVDLGKRKKKDIKRLKKGRGRLMDKVNRAIELARREGAVDKNEQIVPLVFIYSKKQKRRRRRNRGGWF